MPAFFFAFCFNFAAMEFPCRLVNVQLGTLRTALFVPERQAVKAAYQEGLITFPYWSQVWPAAKALSLFLLQHPHYTIKKNVLELGAGLGLPSLVAARNAAHVLCTDAVPEAVETTRQSAAHLHLQNIRTEVLDWHFLPHDLTADVLLLSDINYEPAAFDAMQNVIHFFLQKATTVLLSTPQRLMAKDFIVPLLADCARHEEIAIMHEGKNLAVTIMVLERKNSG